jgi:ABC-type glutathione transport system ATPase component
MHYVNAKNFTTTGAFITRWMYILALAAAPFALYYLFKLIRIVKGFEFKWNTKYGRVKATLDPDEDPMIGFEKQRAKNQEDELYYDSRIIVRAIDLVKEYDLQNKQTKRAVDGVSFIVSKGEKFALLGLSGSGKSSTLKMLLGEEGISNGSAHINKTALTSVYRQPHLL